MDSTSFSLGETIEGRLPYRIKNTVLRHMQTINCLLRTCGEQRKRWLKTQNKEANNLLILFIVSWLATFLECLCGNFAHPLLKK